jgi:hypothetical protein
MILSVTPANHSLNKHEGATCTTNSKLWPIPMP